MSVKLIFKITVKYFCKKFLKQNTFLKIIQTKKLYNLKIHLQ